MFFVPAHLWGFTNLRPTGSAHLHEQSSGGARVVHVGSLGIPVLRHYFPLVLHWTLKKLSLILSLPQFRASFVLVCPVGVFFHYPEVSHVWIDGRSVVYEGKVRTLAVDVAATAPKQQGVGAWGRVGVENIDKRHVASTIHRSDLSIPGEYRGQVEGISTIPTVQMMAIGSLSVEKLPRRVHCVWTTKAHDAVAHALIALN